MSFLWDSITEWLKEVLVSGILSNLTGMFDGVNEKIGDIAGQVGKTPQAWNGGIFDMVHRLSETVILPIAGVILAFIMTLELIQLVTERNSLHDDVCCNCPLRTINFSFILAFPFPIPYNRDGPRID